MRCPSRTIVLVLGAAEDEHAAHMVGQLRNRGAAAHLLDSRWFPQQLALCMGPCGEGELCLPEGVRVRWHDVRSVYWRCYHGVEPPALADAPMAQIAANDSRSLFESMLVTLPARWVNPWRAFELHQRKPAQLARVCSLERPPNLRIPATLQLNDPDRLREFAAAHPGCIFKPVQGGAHTRVLTPEHLAERNLASLRFSPVTVQERIDGADIRVFVAGQRVLACRIQTDATDFRDDPEAPIARFDLPDDIAEACVRIAGALDLLWTGIDLKLAAGGEYYYLEANCSPMFLGFEARSGLPLSAALADLLLDGPG